jgi:hypothetical protein
VQPEDVHTLAEDLTERLAARGVAESIALLDLMRLEQHLIDDLSTVRRLIAAVTRAAVR